MKSIDDSAVMDAARHTFDCDWYKNTYFVDLPKENLFAHYCNLGWKLGYNPSPFFDTEWYSSKNNDLSIWEGNPLYHYLQYGFSEYRSPSPWVDPHWFAKETRHSGDNPLIYYLRRDIAQPADPHPLINLQYIKSQSKNKSTGDFNVFKMFLTDESFYDTNPCVLFNVEWVRKLAGLQGYSSCNILRMYIDSLLDKTISTHPLFDGELYYNRNESVRNFGGSPLVHYILHGSKDLLSPHLLFDPIWYSRHTESINICNTMLESYLSEASSPGTPHPLFNDSYYKENLNYSITEAPLLHYVTKEHNTAKTHPLFDGAWYYNNNPDCARAGSIPLLHYLAHGWKELRNPNSIFQEKHYQSQFNSRHNNIPGLVSYAYGGWRMGYRAHPLFNDMYYLRQLKRQVSEVFTPLGEYLSSNSLEYNTHSDFIDKWYASNYMRSNPSNIRPLEHFTASGIHQCNDPAPWIDLNWYKHTYSTDISIDNLEQAIEKYRARKIEVDPRINIVGKGLERFISDRLGVKPEILYDRHPYQLVPIFKIADSCQGKVSVIRDNITTSYEFPYYYGLKNYDRGKINIDFPSVYVAVMYDVLCRSTSRLVIHGGVRDLAHDEMYYARCPEASSKLYGINVFDNTVYMDDPTCLAYIERGIHLMNEHENNYFHWVVEMLPRIIVLDKSFYEKYPIVLSENLHKNMYDLLDIVVGTGYNVIKIPEKQWIKFGEVVYPSDVTYIPDVYDRPSSPYDVLINAPELKKVRDIVLNYHKDISNPLVKSKVCFFSRVKGMRLILNEEEVINRLRDRFDLSVIHSENYNIKEQVEIFSNLDVAIMPTGASMTNILWCKPGTTVICLFSDHPSLNPYLWQQLAEISQVKLVFVTGERAFDVVGNYEVHDNYFIDADKIISALEESI